MGTGKLPPLCSLNLYIATDLLDEVLLMGTTVRTGPGTHRFLGGQEVGKGPNRLRRRETPGFMN